MASLKPALARVKTRLQGLSFRIGVIVLLMCVPFYALSFAQFALPDSVLSLKAKGVMWIILFGLAKTCQYGGITILGIEGYRRLKARLRRSKKA